MRLHQLDMIYTSNNSIKKKPFIASTIAQKAALNANKFQRKAKKSYKKAYKNVNINKVALAAKNTKLSSISANNSIINIDKYVKKYDEDGLLYNKSEFLDYYGKKNGLIKWNKAILTAPEKRKDINGFLYSKNHFFQYYGKKKGLINWNNVKSNKHIKYKIH